MKEQRKLLKKAELLTEKLRSSHADIVGLEPPQTMFERAEVMNALYRRLGWELFFSRRMMRLLECSQREAWAIKNRRFADFTLERLYYFAERVDLFNSEKLG